MSIGTTSDDQGFLDDYGGPVMTGMTTNEWYDRDGLEMTGMTMVTRDDQGCLG